MSRSGAKVRAIHESGARHNAVFAQVDGPWVVEPGVERGFLLQRSDDH
ncbi:MULTISPECIES: hypothetical protein [unclassified Streptomyces]